MQHIKLRYERQIRLMTQEQLAQLMGVSKQAVSYWETGRTIPSYKKLCDLSRLFGKPIEELLSPYDQRTV